MSRFFGIRLKGFSSEIFTNFVNIDQFATKYHNIAR